MLLRLLTVSDIVYLCVCAPKVCGLDLVCITSIEQSHLTVLHCILSASDTPKFSLVLHEYKAAAAAGLHVVCSTAQKK
jgi:hypothetical protein